MRPFWLSCWSRRNVGAVSKYEPLLQYLLKSDQVLATLSFTQVEEILDAQLPASARRYPAWWGNEVSGSHTQSNAWMDASYHTEHLNLNAQTVSFRKIG